MDSSTEHTILVVLIPAIEKHPDADALGTVEIEGTTIVVNDQWKKGDKAVLIPADFLVPEIEAFAFLGAKVKHRRIKPRKLRGVWSEGLLMPVGALGLPEDIATGTDVMGALGIERYDYENTAHNPNFSACQEATTGDPPGITIGTYKLHPYKKYRTKLVEGEEVLITEKIHGTNWRAVYIAEEDKLYVGSRNLWKDPQDLTSPHTQILQKEVCADIISWCKANPNQVVFGEVYGWVSSLRYGAQPGELLIRLFDVWDNDNKVWREPPTSLPTAPKLYRGPWDPALAETLVDGESRLPFANNIREGIVIECLPDRRDSHLGRVKLKYVSNDYLASGK